MRILTITILFLVTLGIPVVAQTTKSNNLPKVFVAPMTEDFDTFITAALIKRKVPVSIVTSEETADYVIGGNLVEGENKWFYDDSVQGTLQLIRKSDKSIVWAGSAGDKIFWFRLWRKRGQIKAAQRLADAMKKEYFSK